jgi:hypothetical protein
MGNRVKALKKSVSYIVSLCMVLSAMLLAIPVVQAQTTGMINAVSAASGNYYEGNTVNVFVYFNEPVAVTGVPYIETNVGTSVYYKAGDGSGTLEFSGVVPKIQTSMLLNYIGQDSLKLDSGSYIKSVANSLDMNLILPDPQAVNSLVGSNVNLISNTNSMPSGPITLTGTIEAPAGTVLSNVYYNLDIFSAGDFGKRYFEYNVPLQGNKNFQIGGFAPSKNYIISARGFDSNNQVIMQGEVQITTDESGIPTTNNVVIKLMMPQIRCIVNTPAGEIYTLGYPNIRIENINGMQMENYPLISSSENGKYEIYKLPDGEYYMWAEPLGKYYGKSFKIMIKIQNGTLAEVNGTSVTSNICKLTLTEAQIIGTVRTPEGGYLPEGCSINIIGSTDKYKNDTGTNNLGEYNISGLVDGDYTIRATPNGSSNYVASTPQKITIKDGALAEINGNTVTGKTCDFQLNTPTLSGTIEVPTGAVLKDVYYALDVSGVDSFGKSYFEYGVFLQNRNSFKLGSFEPNKTYTIGARAFNSNNQVIMQGEIQITTDGYGNPPADNIIIKLIAPQIKCIVKTPTGEIYNLNYPNIRIEKPDSKWIDNYPMIESTESGKYEVYKLADGDYYIWAESAGKDYGSSSKKLIKIQNGVLSDVYGAPLSANDLEFNLRVPQVVGTVKAPEGGYLQERCDINIIDSEGNMNGFGTNDLGEYNLNDLADGVYTLRAIPNIYSKNNYAASIPKNITIKDGALIEENGDQVTGNVCDLQLSIPSLTGTIESATGEVLTDMNYNVEVYSVDSSGKKYFEYDTFLQDNKAFKLGNLEPNKTYIIHAKCFNNYSARFMQGEIQITTDSNGKPTTNDITIKVADFILGDINRDGTVTIEDAMLVLQNAVGLITFTDEQKKLADVNGDGMITAGDATLILRYAKRLITELPMKV